MAALLAPPPHLQSWYALAIPPHAAAATLAVGTGALALVVRKGRGLHARAGRWYWRAVVGVAASGALLMLLGAWRVRLLVLLALTAQTTWSGVRVLRRRRPDLDVGDRATAADWAVAAAAGLVGVGACAAAAAGVVAQRGAVWATAPLLAAYAGYDLWRFARPAAWPMRPRLWLGEHVVKMTGAYFGGVSALVGSAPVGRALAGVPAAWRVVVPNLVGVVVTAYFLARLRRRRPAGWRTARPGAMIAVS